MDAITDQGTSRDDITLIRREAEYDSAEIYVSITQVERLDVVAQAAREVVARSNRVALLDMGWANLMTENECNDGRREARDSALADARTRAEAAVKGFDVVIGDIVSVDEGSEDSPPCSLCAATPVETKFDRLPIRAYIAGEVLQEVFIATRRVTFEVRSR